MLSLSCTSYFTRPPRTSSITITVGFLDEVGRNGRAPFCNWRARLAATMMNRFMLCSGSSGMEQWELFLGLFSDISTDLKRFYLKGSQDRLDLRLHTDTAHPLGPHDRRQRFGGRLQLIVNNNVIVFAIIPDFACSIAQPAADYLVGVLRPGTQPFFQDLAGWRKNEDRNRVRNLSLQLSRTLDVNVEYQVLSLTLSPIELAAVCAVVIPPDIGVLEELSPRNASLELVT